MNKTLSTIVALCAAGAVQAQSPSASMDRAVSAYSKMQTVRAEFTQTITNPITGTTAVSRGVLLRKQPDLLSITFTDPKGDRVVSDGQSLWVYLPSSAPGQVIRMPAKGNSSMAIVDPSGVFLSSPSTRYIITAAGTATIAGRRTSAMNLVPKTSNARFTRARVWVDVGDYSIRQFEVTEASGLTRLITITSLQPNAKISQSAFSFTPPKGARVLDSSALSGT